MTRPALFVLAALLAACTAPSSPPPRTGDALTTAEHPRFASEAAVEGIALFNLLQNTGLSPEELTSYKLKIERILARDPEGNPAAHYVFFLRQGEPWHLEVIGASPERPVNSFSQHGKGLYLALKRTERALRETADFAGYRTVAGGPDLFLEDSLGRWWPAGAEEPLPPSRKRELLLRYGEIQAAPSFAGATKAIRQAWEELLAFDTPAARRRFLEPGGGLDLGAALAALRELDGRGAWAPLPPPDKRWTVPDRECLGVWIFQTCFAGERGGLDPLYDDIPGGNYGAAANFGHDAPFKNPANLGFGEYVANNLLGCGPTSFTSVAWWLWKHRGIRWYGLPYDGTPPLYTKDYRAWRHPVNPYPKGSPMHLMTLPNDRGQAEIAARMGSFEWYGSTATWPYAFAYGAKGWIEEQAERYQAPEGEVRFAFEALPFGGANPVTSTPEPPAVYPHLVAALVRETGKVRPSPVVALYQPHIDVLHYSPIVRYRVIYYPRPSVLVWTVDHPDWGVSITNPFTLVRGAFAFLFP